MGVINENEKIEYDSSYKFINGDPETGKILESTNDFHGVIFFEDGSCYYLGYSNEYGLEKKIYYKGVCFDENGASFTWSSMSTECYNGKIDEETLKKYFKVPLSWQFNKVDKKIVFFNAGG